MATGKYDFDSISIWSSSLKCFAKSLAILHLISLEEMDLMISVALTALSMYCIECNERVKEGCSKRVKELESIA